MDALQTCPLAQRLEHHREWDRAAVRVGDDAFVVLDVPGVHLWDDKGHVLLHPPGRAVVHYQCARLDCRRGVDQGDIGAGGEERYIDAVE